MPIPMLIKQRCSYPGAQAARRALEPSGYHVTVSYWPLRDGSEDWLVEAHHNTWEFCHCSQEAQQQPELFSL